jgi:hypothetical protein
VAPGAYRAWLERPRQQELEDRALAELGDSVLQIHPPVGSPDVDSAARDTALLARALQIGRTAVLGALSAVIPAA